MYEIKVQGSRLQVLENLRNEKKAKRPNGQKAQGARCKEQGFTPEVITNYELLITGI